MFGLNLSIPEHVQMNLDPNPDDGGKTYLLVITAKASEGGETRSLRKTIPRNIGAIQFGKDLMAAINHLYHQLRS